MHEQQPQEQERDGAPEQPPQIYVASLSDYNDGRLHGTWLDAARSVDELEADIDQLLWASPIPGAEEWAIHDYEGFGPVHLDEYTSLTTVTRLAQGIAAHGEAFAALAGWLGVEDATLDRFEQHYRGTWESLPAYVEELFADLGVEDYLQGVPEWIRPYVRVDIETFARDLELAGDIYAAETRDGVAVFDASG